MNFLFGYKMVSVLLILNTSHDIPEYGLRLRHSVSIGQFLSAGLFFFFFLIKILSGRWTYLDSIFDKIKDCPVGFPCFLSEEKIIRWVFLDFIWEKR